MSEGCFSPNNSVAKLFSFGSQCLLRLAGSTVFAAVFISAAAADTEAATTYYVAKSGGHNYTCAQAQSASTPKLTIADGLACMASSDALVIKAGTYIEGINDTIPSGSSNSAHTIIKAAEGESVIIRPSLGVGPTGNVIYLYNGSNITIDGLIVDGANVAGNGIYLNGTYSNVRIINNEVKNAVNTGEGNCITVQGAGASNTHIINNKVHNCGNSTFHHGIYLWGSGHLVERNEIYNNTGHGVHQYKGSGIHSNNIIRYNYIYDNRSRCAIIGSGHNNLFHHNICVGNSVATGSSAIRVDSLSPDNSQIYNNTFYNNNGVCIEIWSGTNAKVKNNLCLSNKVNTISNSGTGTTIVHNSLSADATLVKDAANNQFIPRENSALIDTGEIISGFSLGKFLGGAPDKGALEFGSDTKPTPTALNAPGYLQVR